VYQDGGANLPPLKTVAADRTEYGGHAKPTSAQYYVGQRKQQDRPTDSDAGDMQKKVHRVKEIGGQGTSSNISPGSRGTEPEGGGNERCVGSWHPCECAGTGLGGLGDR